MRRAGASVMGASMIPLALLPVALLTGCAEALFSHTSYRSDAAFDATAFSRYVELRRTGAPDKPAILRVLGPPMEVIGQARGEAFLYRREAVDTSIVNLNPAMASGLGPVVPIPLYFGSFRTGRDDLLMLFFDEKGRLRGDSLRLGIDEGGWRGLP